MRADASNATNVWKATVRGRRRQRSLLKRARCGASTSSKTRTVERQIFWLSTRILSANLRVTSFTVHVKYRWD